LTISVQFNKIKILCKANVWYTALETVVREADVTEWSRNTEIP